MKIYFKYVVIIAMMIAGISCSTVREESGDDTVEITKAFTDSVRQYDMLFPFSEGLAAVKKGDKFGFIDTKGTEVIPCQFVYVGPFKEGLAFAVSDNDSPVSFINKEGASVKTTYPLDESYYMDRVKNGYFDESMLAFNNGICEINYSEKKGSKHKTIYIDKELKEVSKPTVSSTAAKSKTEYTIFTKKEKDIYGDDIELKGVKDRSGAIVVPAKYNNIMLGDNGVAVACLFVEDAKSHLHPKQPYGMEIYGYVDFKGNSTFTEADNGKLEGYSTAQRDAFTALKDKEKQEEDYEDEQYEPMVQQERYSEQEHRVSEESSSKIKEVYLEYTSEFGEYISVNGNYGWNVDRFAGLLSNVITIPWGKKWIFRGVNRDMDGRIFYQGSHGNGSRAIKVFTHSRESYTFYGGDNIKVAIRPILDNPFRHEKVVFTFIEKSEYD